MIDCDIKLIILVLDEKSNSYKILSSDKNNLIVPSFAMESKLDIDLCLNHILEQYIKTENFIHSFKITDVKVSEKLEIYYVVFIAYQTIIKDGFALDINTSTLSNIPNNAQKIILLL